MDYSIVIAGRKCSALKILRYNDFETIHCDRIRLQASLSDLNTLSFATFMQKSTSLFCFCSVEQIDKRHIFTNKTLNILNTLEKWLSAAGFFTV
jgi:hypothetical protein